jgi:hypothetical protein
MGDSVEIEPLEEWTGVDGGVLLGPCGPPPTLGDSGVLFEEGVEVAMYLLAPIARMERATTVVVYILDNIVVPL